MKLRILALCACVWIAFLPNLALSQTPATTDSDPVSGKQYGRAGIYDASGVLRMTEEYPMFTATASPFTECNAVPVTTTLTKMGNGFSAYPYGLRSLYIKRTATGGAAVDPLYLYLFSSEDDITYYPVLNPNAFLSIPFAAGDTTKVDTMMVSIPAKGPTFEAVMSLPVDLYGYIGKYIAIYAKRDQTTSTVQTLTLIWTGRQK